jgi:CcmD family protein
MGFFEHYAYLVVLAATLLVWFGMFFYTYKIDKRIRQMEKEELQS